MKKTRKPSKIAKRELRQGRHIPPAPTLDVPMRRFIDSVPDKEFAEALEHAPDPKFQTFLAARADPAYRGLSFAALCRKFNIPLADVDDLWRQHQLHVGMIDRKSTRLNSSHQIISYAVFCLKK